MLTSGPKKLKRRIEDRATWMEAFLTFMLVLSSYFPHRWKDLCQYQLLILQTHRQFASRVWLSYDRAFRQHAAATNLVDWSSINVQLFNFHAAGSSVRGRNDVPSGSSEPSGSSLPIVVPGVRGFTVPHPALVSRLTSPRPIPNGGSPPLSPCALVANPEECDCCLMLGHASCFFVVFCYLSFRTLVAS